ncbi:hypothetical protein BC941DRAFT_477051 [Chlamydoabsidia padenii]|nr:hypothetical protein BC941DRAFT_477051 [Chlamydoabsidia padenii]
MKSNFNRINKELAELRDIKSAPRSCTLEVSMPFTQQDRQQFTKQVTIQALYDHILVDSLVGSNVALLDPADVTGQLTLKEEKALSLYYFLATLAGKIVMRHFIGMDKIMANGMLRRRVETLENSEANILDKLFLNNFSSIYHTSTSTDNNNKIKAINKSRSSVVIGMDCKLLTGIGNTIEKVSLLMALFF